MARFQDKSLQAFRFQPHLSRIMSALTFVSRPILFVGNFFHGLVPLLALAYLTSLVLYDSASTPYLSHLGPFIPTINWESSTVEFGDADFSDISPYNPLVFLIAVLSIYGIFRSPQIASNTKPISTHIHSINPLTPSSLKIFSPAFNSVFSLLSTAVEFITRTIFKLTRSKPAVTTKDAKDGATDVVPLCTILPPTIYLLLLNACWCYYKWDGYNLFHCHQESYNCDSQTVLKMIANVLGKIGMVNFGIFLIPVSEFSPVLAALSISQEIAYAFHRSAAILSVLQFTVHGVLHFVRFLGQHEEGVATPSIVHWMVWPEWACWGQNEAYTVAYTCDDCTCYHLKRNATGFWSAFLMLLVCFTSTPQFRRRHYSLFYLAHVLFALPAIVLMLLHWNSMVGYFLPSLIVYGMSKR